MTVVGFRRLCVVAALVAAAAAPLRAADIHVSPAGGGDGSAASPTDLQSALATAAANGESDTLLLQSGTYAAPATFTFAVETDDVDKTDLTVSGGWNAGFTAQARDRSSVLDGQGARRVLALGARGAGADVVVALENLTVRNGRTEEHAEPPGDGGHGAGILATPLEGARLKLLLRECTVQDNAAVAAGSRGGGLAAGGEHELRGCVFERNRAGGGGAVDVADGAHALIEGCEFSANTADHWGGAIHLWDGGAEIRNCLFAGNAAGAAPGSDGRGGALSLYDPDGIGSPRAATVVNSTFVGNRVLGSSLYGGAIYSRVETLAVRNSIFWDNGSPDNQGGERALYRESGDAAIGHSDAEGGLDGTGFLDGGGNIDAAPFAGGEWAYPYRLAADSPCVDAGSNAAVPVGLEADWEGDPRIFGHGEAATRTVDQGRDEHYDGVFALTAPAPGANWLNDGTAKTIAWTCTNIHGAVSLALWKVPFTSGAKWPITTDPVPCADRSYSWTIPGDLPDGFDYAVVLASVEFPVLLEWNPIAIQHLRLTAPNAGALVQGSTYPITWESGGLAGALVRIELYAGAAPVHTIADAAPNTGSFSWKVPYTLAPREGLQLRISTTAPLAAEDFSDGLLRVLPAVTLTVPNGGQSWKRGQTYRVSWSYRNKPGSAVRLDLFRGGLFNRVIARNVPIGAAGKGSYLWFVPLAQAQGTNYTVRVRSEKYPTCFDFGNRPFAITK